MAAPKNNTSAPNAIQQAQTRAAIKATQLVKRLQYFALGQLDEQGNPVELDGPRVRAIEVLLKKICPDLSSVDLSGEVGVTVLRQTIYESKPDE